MNDSMVECVSCGKREEVSFAKCLREGWPRCCALTMRLLKTVADIEHAVGEAMHEALEGARHLLQLPGAPPED
jgi:hypothetical protein